MGQRDYFFDNAKFILIFFVVFGHLIRSFIEDSETIYTLYKVIYTFHMPAFILVSGFFAKGYYQKGYIQKIAKKLILPYLIFQLIYSVFYYFLHQGAAFNVDPLNPHWSLWFLISLFFWHLLLLIFAKFKPSVAIILSFAIGLAVGYADWVSNYLSLSRTFVFFPFFLLGYLMKKEHFQVLFRPSIRLGAVGIFVAVFVLFYFNPNINYEWLLGSKPYSVVDDASISSMLIRLGFYLLSLMMMACFFAFVPNRHYSFTKLGKNTLYVYLLHGFFVRIFRESEVQDFFNDPRSFLLLAGLALVLTLLLSSKWVTAVTQPLIELSTARFKQLKRQIRTIFRYYRRKYRID
ncbi:acyltransferase family protein [Cytobacillus sp. FSL K6-0265]|uniref:acyltransferase family protein n=1 Tax=Cytobacillus sp. FSL K6-0265 TaxID=2921448 RepID=UPI0030F4C1CF